MSASRLESSVHFLNLKGNMQTDRANAQGLNVRITETVKGQLARA
jgi:hypothetical protein